MFQTLAWALELTDMRHKKSMPHNKNVDVFFKQITTSHELNVVKIYFAF